MLSALGYERIINNFIHFHYFFIALVIILSIQMFLNILKGHFVAKISKQVNEKLLNSFYEKIFNLPMSFFKDRETGEVISRFTDIGEIRNLIAEGGVTIIINIFMVLVGGIILLQINEYMFFIVMIILFIYNYCYGI